MNISGGLPLTCLLKVYCRDLQECLLPTASAWLQYEGEILALHKAISPTLLLSHYFLNLSFFSFSLTPACFLSPFSRLLYAFLSLAWNTLHNVHHLNALLFRTILKERAFKSSKSFSLWNSLTFCFPHLLQSEPMRTCVINVCYVCKQSLLAPCSGTDSGIPVIAVTMNCCLWRWF